MLGTFLKARVPLLALIVVAFCLPTLFAATGHTFFILVGCFVFLYVIAVSGLDIVFGYSGQISIGHAAFFAIGAYASGIINNLFEIPVLFSMFIASIIATGIAALLAYPASKLVFHFLSLATIAFGEIVYQIIINSPGAITGNFRGMFANPVSLFGFALNNNNRFYYFGLVCAIVFLLVKHFIVKSKVGRAFIAIRENSRAADGMGIDVRKYKVIAFAVSAFYTGWAGGMYMHYIRYISPETFRIYLSITFLIMLMFGGNASIMGPVVGVLAVTILTEGLRPLQEYNMLIFGIMLLLAILIIPGGIWGESVRIYKQLSAKFAKNRKERATDA